MAATGSVKAPKAPSQHRDKAVAWAGLYRVKPGLLRLDVAPFALAYSVLWAGALAPFLQEQQQQAGGKGVDIPLWVLVLMPAVLLLHVLTHLSTHWAVACDALVAYTHVKTVAQATHVRVRPPPNSGSEELVPVLREAEIAGDSAGEEDAAVTVVGKDFPRPFARFHFQKAVFCYWRAGAGGGEFTRLAYPTEGLVLHFLQRKGFGEGRELRRARALWGENVFDIPLPPFGELFKEHAVAPFFVFQVLCVLLWSLDEYWYYSIFTLVLLVVFESTVCYQRRQSLEMLRSMRRPAYPVWCFREGKWEEVSTEALLPGDLVSLGRMNAHPEEQDDGNPHPRKAGNSLSKFRGRGGGRAREAEALQRQREREQEEALAAMSVSERLVPCDLLLLRGSCVVNEAMLTGESTPQLKERLDLEGKGKGEEDGSDDDGDDDGKLRIARPAVFALRGQGSGESEARAHVVFGGTKVLQLGGGGGNNSNSSSSSSSSGGGGEKEEEGGESGSAAAAVLLPRGVPSPPDSKKGGGGAVGMVLRTGFETSQGQLMRTILFATRRVTAGDAETAVFIGILLLFAVAASAVVLTEGLKDEGRNRFKLLLHCIMIVTSVVPPELPMELSLAVTNSLAALTRSLIYCTEPFRIPYAGKVTACCFDKTGTLTSDDLVMQGVVPLAPRASPSKDNDAAEESILPPARITGPALWVLAGCHSLMTVDGRVAGDPMERAAVEGLGWSVASNGDVVVPPSVRVVVPAGGEGVGDADRRDWVPIRIHHRYPFSSALRRMSVLASRPLVDINGRQQPQQQLLLLTKGAPEAVQPLLKHVPANYAATYLYHMGRGRRVLALAYRELSGKGEEDLAAARQWGREEAEAGLTLAGLLVVDCPLKKDTAGVIAELQASRHRTVMITGDSELTAAEVARQVGMVRHGPDGTYHLLATTGGMGWEPMTNLMRPQHQDTNASSTTLPEPGEGFVRFSIDGVAGLVAGGNASLCVGGEALSALLAEREGEITGVTVAAPAPEEEDEDEDEEDESTLLSAAAAAKKQASSSSSRGIMARASLRWLAQLCPHVAVFARVAPEQKEALIAALNAAGEVTLMCGDGTNDVGALKQAHVGVSIINSPELEKRAEATGAKYERRLEEMGQGAEGAAARAQVSAAAGLKPGVEEDLPRLAQMLAELREQEKDPSIVQLGDASIASPFTAKRTSVECVLAVVRQGRCTLVTTLQVYKILALNCLVSAYMLSSLYLFGVKQGDGQMTALGLAVAALFFFVSRAEPLEKLSATRPPSRIFCAQVCLSIVGQFLVHLYCLMSTLELAKPLVARTRADPAFAPDGPFRPNVVNTAIFLLSAVTQVNTFTANYRGEPFMQALWDNRALRIFTLGLYACLLGLALEVVPPANAYLQLVPLPSPFKRQLTQLLLLDTAAVLAIEKACLRFFPAG